jgi:hypothetical protein
MFTMMYGVSDWSGYFFKELANSSILEANSTSFHANERGKTGGFSYLLGESLAVVSAESHIDAVVNVEPFGVVVHLHTHQSSHNPPRYLLGHEGAATHKGPGAVEIRKHERSLHGISPLYGFPISQLLVSEYSLLVVQNGRCLYGGEHPGGRARNTARSHLRSVLSNY